MRLITILFLSLLLYNCKSGKAKDSDKDKILCENYKTGKYYINFKEGNTVFEIDRQTTTQTEYNRKTDTIEGFQVSWSGPCEYELKKTFRAKKKGTDSADKKPIFEVNNPALYKVRIITGTRDYYVFEIQTAGVNLLKTDTAWVLK
jgi:hypothetical protein